MQVSVTRREAELKLDESEFDSRKMINKRKKLILAGKSPEEADEIIRKMEEKKKKWEERRKSGGGVTEKRGDREGGGKKTKDKSKTFEAKMKKLKDRTRKPEKEGQKLESEGRSHVVDSKEKKLVNAGKKKGSIKRSNIEELKDGNEEIIEPIGIGLKSLNVKNKEKRKSYSGRVDVTPVKKRKSLGIVWNECESVDDGGVESVSGGEKKKNRKRGKVNQKEIMQKRNSESGNEVSSSRLTVGDSKTGTSDLRFLEKKSLSQLGKRKMKRKSKSSKLSGQESLGSVGDSLRTINLIDVKKKERKLKRNAADLKEIKDLLGL